MIDAYSKWLEIQVTNSATSTATIELMRKSFASLGIPETVVSDNATTFTSEEFAGFLKRNGIRHIRSPPYHPASNGLVERAVQTFKEGMKRLKLGSLNTRLSRFLLRYRITPHSSTGSSPSELLWGRKLRSQLDLLLPDTDRKMQQAQDRQKQSHDAHSASRLFLVDDTVYARNYGPGPRWLPGLVVGLQGSAMFQIRLSDNHVVVRHVDQLRHRQCSDQTFTSASNSAAEDTVIDDDSSTRTAETETAVVDSTNSADQDPPSSVATQDTTDQLEGAEAPVVVPSESEGLLEHPGDGTAEPPVRRSTRVRQPPVRFEEQCLVIT